MKKEDYLQKRKEVKQLISDATSRLDSLRSEFIELNKPCNIGDSIEVITHGDRKVKGIAHSFSINSTSDVYVSSIKPLKGAIVYLSIAHKSIKII